MTPSEPTRRWRSAPFGTILLALVAYVPLLLTAPGEVGADTKSYLYLDPGRLLSRAAYMWDTNIGFGTITHQNIGYLWPMGPYYWLMQSVGVPDWIAQRLWLGSILFLAGLGIRFMLKELRWTGPGLTVAAFAYAFSPYILDYGARISVILLPFAGLPWLIGAASKSLRQGGWRWPSVFALITLTVGGVNATSLLLVMVAPVLWFAHATFVSKEVTFKRAMAAGGRITFLTLITSLWWMIGLSLQGKYGIPILRYTESYFTVAGAALSTELLRGLGYWFFYGRDALGVWTKSSQAMVQSTWLLAVSYLLPILAFASGVLSRFRHRGFFALVTVIGLVLAVGTHPWDNPSPYGAAFKAASRTDAGLAFRSTPRAVPLIALGLAVFLGAAVAAISAWNPKWHLVAAGGLIGLVCLNQVALFRGQLVDRNLERDQDVPEYWIDAANALSQGDTNTRAYEMPGTDFASYRWGNTVDPITPGLTDRDYAARELIPYGSPGSANLLNNWDETLQQGRLDPATIAPMARMLGIGDIVHRADLQYERFRTPRPRPTQEMLETADGLGPPESFGSPTPNQPVDILPLDDEREFATPDTVADPAPVSIFPVEDPQPMLRTVDASSPIVMSGDGNGLVALASAGMLDPGRPVLYSASATDHEGTLERALDESNAEVVVSDTNRRQARRWGSVRENDGYTERAGETALERDPADNRLELFPDADDDDRTIAEAQGGATARASGYGNPVSYTAADRAENAIDGDPSTTWQVGAFSSVLDEYLEIAYDPPVTTDRLTILQTQRPTNRSITEVSLSFDGGDPMPVPLDDTSRTPPGQEITFPSRTFSTLRITIENTDIGERTRWEGISGVGIAEVSIPGVEPTIETIRPPVDLLDRLGSRSIDLPLTYLFSRRAASPFDVTVNDEEPQLRRWVVSPDARSFTPFGKFRMNTTIADDEVDRLLGLPSADEGSLTATSSGHLPGDLRSRSAAAVDGDEATAFQSPVNGAVGSWIEVRYPSPVAFDHLPMSVVTDGRHSVARSIDLTVDGAAPVPFDLDALDKGDGRERGATTTVDLATGPVTGTTFRFTVTGVDETRSLDWFSHRPTVVPIGIAELGLPVTRAQPAPDAAIPSTCRSDLVAVDGAPVPMKPVATVEDVLNAIPARLESCGGPVHLLPGRTLLTSTAGAVTGFDVDLFALASAAGGAPGSDTVATPPPPAPPGPDTTTSRPGRLTYDVDVTDAADPYWVVLGQSHNAGWHLSVDGKDLGEPTLINGFANGWRVDPATVGATVTLHLEWTPQRLVLIGLIASAFGVLICLALLVWPLRLWAGRPLPIGSIGDLVVRAVGPFDTEGSPVPAGRAVLTSVAVGVVTGLLMGPWVGLGVSVTTAIALLFRWGQVVLRITCVGLLAASAGYIVLKQFRNGYVIDFDWMNHFEVVHAWGLAAAALLAVDPLVEVIRRRRT